MDPRSRSRGACGDHATPRLALSPPSSSRSPLRSWRLAPAALSAAVAALGTISALFPAGSLGAKPAISPSTGVPNLIWGPVLLPNGESAFPVYHRLGVNVFQIDLNWAQTAPTRPAQPSNADDPAYQWPAQLNLTLSQARRYGIKICLLVQGTTITSTMLWTFAYRPTYTKILALSVNAAPVGATVVVKCHGIGCPFAKRSTPVKRCRSTPSHACKHESSATIGLEASFRKRRLDFGTGVSVQILRPGWIGKYYLFTMRAGRGPKIEISCLAPGRTSPGRGC